MATTEGPKKPKKPLKKAKKEPKSLIKSTDPADQKLTARQEAFCHHYSLSLNGAEAARLSGYKVKSAAVIACENLTKPNIQRKISELRRYMANEFNLTRESIIQEYAKVARFNSKALFKADGSLIPIHELPDDVAAAVASVEIVEDDITFQKLKKVKTYDKIRALDSLKKLLGYDEPDKHEVTGAGGAPLHPALDLSKYTDDELLAIAELQRKGRAGETPAT